MSVRHSKVKRQTTGVLYFRKISPAVKSQFKSVCVRRGESMQEVIEALMIKYIEKPEEIKIRKYK